MLCHQCGSDVEASAGSCANCGAELTQVRRLKLSESRGLRISQELKAIRLDQQLFPPGEEVAGRFVLKEMLGKGPFGEVYRANLMRHFKDPQVMGVTYCACMFDQGGNTLAKNNQNGFYSLNGKYGLSHMICNRNTYG